MPRRIAVVEEIILRYPRHPFTRIGWGGRPAWLPLQNGSVSAIENHLTPAGAGPLPVRDKRFPSRVIHSNSLLSRFYLPAKTPFKPSAGAAVVAVVAVIRQPHPCAHAFRELFDILYSSSMAAVAGSLPPLPPLPPTLVPFFVILFPFSRRNGSIGAASAAIFADGSDNGLL